MTTKDGKILDANDAKECSRCHKTYDISGAYCASCKRDLADEVFLDDGSEAIVEEEADRAVQGEYAEMNEGDDTVKKNQI